MYILLCYPLLDLRFLLDAQGAPPRPDWLTGSRTTVGSLGRVIATAGDGSEGEIRANSAILFPSEYKRMPKARGRRRWLEAPAVNNDVRVSARRLVADTDGHVRIEIILQITRETPINLEQVLDRLLVSNVEVVRSARTDAELVSAGFQLAQVYLRQSAKTAAPSESRLLDTLLREGEGSPFVIVLGPGQADTLPAGVKLEPPNKDYPAVVCSLMELAGHTLGVWQIWGAGRLVDWHRRARSLCRIICYLSEVTLLADIQRNPAVLAPYALDPAATDHFFRVRGGQLRQKWYDNWPVQSVYALAAQHLKVSIDERTSFRESLADLRRDVRGDLSNSLERIGHSTTGVQLASPGKPAHAGASLLKSDDLAQLAGALSQQARQPPGVEDYFRRLVEQSDLPQGLKREQQGALTGDADKDARRLIAWALSHGANPNDSRYSVLGSILAPELARSGIEPASAMLAAMIAYNLCGDELLERLRSRFQIPAYADEGAAGPDFGPDFVWHGGEDLVLETLLPKRSDDFYDMGFWYRAVLNARSVCLVTVGAYGSSGTGVLIASDLVLTNHHVLAPPGQKAATLDDTARSVTLAFGTFTDPVNSPRTFGLDAKQPVVAFSPTAELDFALLRVASDLAKETEIQSATIGDALPKNRSSMSILQHPSGGGMKLSVSENAVVYADEKSGIIQYAAHTASGSSGAPCFDDQWRLVALHHAERARRFGTVREGILLQSICRKISPILAAK